VSFVEIFYLPLEEHGFDIDLDQALEYLDEAELGRYQRFKNEHSQSCFLQARRIVKKELAKKLNCQPKDIVFSYTDTEKPFLKNHPQWHFNISHSHSTIVVVLSEQCVGVDVEDVDRCMRIFSKADDFLNGFVKLAVDACDTERESAAVFAEHWTCTESYIKLKGSAIYRDKDKVKAQYLRDFSQGKLRVFENIHFTTFTFSEYARISVATEDFFPEIKMTHWRTGNCVFFTPKFLDK